MANERRLIDANALKRTIRAESWVRKQIVHLTLEFINLMIDEQPTVDAVEVVRCKDCRHYVETDLWCNLNCCVGDSHANWYPEDFCSYGERKDDAR